MVNVLENFNESTQIKVDYERYQMLLENLEYYKSGIRLIKDEIFGLKSLTKEDGDTIKDIANIIEELEKELNNL